MKKTLMLGKIEGRRRRGQQRRRWLDGITNLMDRNMGKLQEMVRNRKACCAAVHGVTKELDMTLQLNNNSRVCKSQDKRRSHGEKGQRRGQSLGQHRKPTFRSCI